MRSVYAIGDLHGRADLLLALVERILTDSGDADDPVEIVFLGDYVDRGPNSREVLEFLIAAAEWPEVRPVFLLGNHELMLLRFLADPMGERRWLRYGGYDTLLSYGIGNLGDLDDRNELRRIASALREAMGAHLEFIEDLRPWHRNGNVLFTHAGADPGLAPDEQTIDALAWGVPEFETEARSDGLWVVHGHVIVPKPLVRPGRISVDTGAWTTGRLTALKIVGSEISFLTQTGPEGPTLD